MKFYAGIGSRETPPDVLRLMTLIAATQAMRGWTLRTGIAPGADQAFAVGAGPLAEWSLPWLGFEEEFQTAQLASYPPPKPTILLPTATEVNVAKQYHPAWDRLSQGAQKLHARNVLQVLGPCVGNADFIQCSQASAFVVCWTKDGKASGGTGQAIRIAEAYGIPVRNLHDPKTREAAERFVNGEE